MTSCLDYLRAGISVLPIRTDGTKAPAVDEWKQWQTERMSEAEALGLFHGCGIAIIGGAISGNLEILDFDKPGAYEEWLASLDEATAAVAIDLPTIETPDEGRHVYLRSPAVESSTKLAMAAEPFASRHVPGKQKLVIAETKAEGGYVLAPGSPAACHESGRQYVHLSGVPITSTPVVEIATREALLAAARALSERPLDERRATEHQRKPLFDTTRPGDDYNSKASWADLLTSHGWHVDRVSGAITYWCRPGKQHGVSATTGRCGHLLYVFSSNAAPFDADRGYDLFGAYARLVHANDIGAATRALSADGYGKQERSKARTGAPSTAADRIEDLGERLGRIEKAVNEVVFERGSEVELARDLLARLQQFGGQVVSAHGELHQYDDRTGAWESLPRGRILGVIQGYDGAWIEHENAKGETKRQPLRLAKRTVEGVYGCALNNYETQEPGFFADAPSGVLVGNGFATVDADGIRLKPHSAEHRARYPLPLTFDDNADVRPWRDFMHNLFQDDEDHEEKTATLQEFVGAALAGIAPQYATCMVLTGAGANGKSTFIELVSRLFPPHTVTSIAPHHWGKDYFVSRLSGSMLNACNELPEGEILSGETFKAVVTGENVMARDPYQSPYKFAPRCGHVFACNALPGTADHTEGFWRRFMVVEFTRNFAAEPNMRTKDQVVRDLVPHLPAAMLWALHGAVRLIRRGHYTKPKSHTAAIGRWRTDSNSVSAWLESESLAKAVNGDPWMKANTAYGRYNRWCETNGLHAVSSVKFSRRLLDLGYARAKRADANYISIMEGGAN